MNNITEIKVENLKLSYSNNILMSKVSFEILRGDIFIIMGASGSGKSTLLKSLIGLKQPSMGKVLIQGKDFYNSNNENRKKILQNCGILYQNGALFSTMTIAENVAFPLQQFTSYSKSTIDKLVELKLSLVGLRGYNNFYPDELSGGMKKRASLARAIALDPQILYFDEPSSGLDPISSQLLDELILDINANLGTTIVIISHDINSILSIGKNAIYLDSEKKQIIAKGNPKKWVKNPPNQTVANFFRRSICERP